MFLPTLVYEPDLDNGEPARVVSVQNKVPTARGFESAKEAQTGSLTALGTACLGACVTEQLNGTRRLFAGTNTQLFEGTSGVWVDRTRATAYSCVVSAIAIPTWCFAQYGDITFASQKNDPIQQSATASGTFTDLTSAPGASIIETVNEFLFAFDTNDATYGDGPNRWRCCALGNVGSWTADLSTQAATGTIGPSAGKFTAAKRFGDSIIAYKSNSMYRGDYVGHPVIWSWVEISSSIGAGNNHCVIPVTLPQGGAAHIILNSNGVFMYTGGAPVDIGRTVKKALTRSGSWTASGVATAHDPVKRLIYIFDLHTISTGVCFVYNYAENKWGDHKGGGASLISGSNWVAMTVSYIGNTFGYFTNFGVPIPAVFVTNNGVSDKPRVLATLSKTTTTSQIGMGRIGKEGVITTIRRIRPRYAQTSAPADPTSSVVNLYSSMNADASLTLDGNTSSPVSYSNGRYDFMTDARYHQFIVTDTGDCEICGFDVDVIETSDE